MSSGFSLSVTPLSEQLVIQLIPTSPETLFSWSLPRHHPGKLLLSLLLPLVPLLPQNIHIYIWVFSKVLFSFCSTSCTVLYSLHIHYLLCSSDHCSEAGRATFIMLTSKMRKLKDRNSETCSESNTYKWQNWASSLVSFTVHVYSLGFLESL